MATKTTNSSKTPRATRPAPEPMQCKRYEPRREFDCERTDCVHYPQDPIVEIITNNPPCKHFQDCK